MITFILEAKRIPDGTKVRKSTGSNLYTLQREIKIYMPNERSITTEGMVFLLGDNAINGYPENHKFAVDVRDDEAMEFLQTILGEEE